LIEASAGTGKTFTIALLYVRLVLGHGGETHGFGKALTPPEILVVTFTEAATQELRDRIRARLAEAAQCFRADPLAPNPIGDEPLRRLRDQYLSTAWPTCARKLEIAAEWMDEAAVSTIHGWCNRMLHEHAFDSLSLFTQTLETDPSEMRADVVRDYWRKFHYTLTPEEATQITALWQDPDALERAVKPLLPLAAKLPPAPAPAEALAQNQQARVQTLQQLKAPWVTWVDELREQLEEARANKRINGTKLRSTSYLKWLAEIQAWATTERENLELTPAAWNRLTPQGIAEAWVVGEPLAHPALLATASLRRAFTELPTPKAALLSHAARWVATELEATQRGRSLLSFDDLLGQLQAALDSPNGSRLADIIRAQFPVALIDEF
jgi:exodeoxyribonuclease V beta subunit